MCSLWLLPFARPLILVHCLPPDLTPTTGVGLKIAFDGTVLHGRKSGVGYYCEELLKAVATSFEEETRKLLCKCVPFTQESLREIIRSQKLRCVQHVLDIYGKEYSTHFADAIRKLRLEDRVTLKGVRGPVEIRALYAESVGENSVHGSDSPENAALEIAQFFTEADIVG